jgi:hypothetical protein
MVLERRQFQKLSELQRNEVLVVNPRNMAILFSLGLASKKLKRIIKHIPVIEGYIVWSSPVYGVIFLRLPHSQEEHDYMNTLAMPEIWEVDDKNDGIIVTQKNEELIVENCTENEGKKLLILAEKKGIFEKFPLFPYFFELPFFKPRSQIIQDMFEILRIRLNEGESVHKSKGSVVKVVTKDYLQFSSIKSEHGGKVVGCVVGDDFLKKYSRLLFGSNLTEKTSGLEFVSMVLRNVGEDALPYTIYMIGDGSYNPYQFKDYFTQIYPGLGGQFIGVSSSAASFFSDEIKRGALIQDIAAKKPDLLLIGSVDRKLELLLYNQLMEEELDFGVGILLGGALDLQRRSQKRDMVGDATLLLRLFRA